MNVYRGNRCVKLCFAFLLIAVNSGCMLGVFIPAPKRTFTPTDLLIGLNDVPSGWSVLFGPEKVGDDSRSFNSSEIAFSSGKQLDRWDFKQSVFRYSSIEGAKMDYSDAITFPGETNIKGWTFSSSIADEQKISCFTYSNVDIPVCRWQARYQEFVVEVIAWIYPCYLSIEEMQNLVNAIDLKFTNYIGGKNGR
jgi:hypothetical protein